LASTTLRVVHRALDAPPRGASRLTVVLGEKGLADRVVKLL